MNIVQDIYTKSVLGTLENSVSVGQETPYGMVASIKSGNSNQLVFVKSSVSHDITGNKIAGNTAFLSYLEQIVLDRKNNPNEKSYTASLLKRGINKVAQKVGEEAVELVIEAKDDDKDLFLNEASDLLYHITVLLVAKDYTFDEVMEILIERNS